MGDTIVVMGGNPSVATIPTVLSERPVIPITYPIAEYLVLGENKWKELPRMHHERAGATACVLP